MSTSRHPASTGRLLIVFGLLFSLPAVAADWSDTYMGYRYGTQFRESFVTKADGSAQTITKNIFNLDHTSGYKYGINWFNVDFLFSNANDPAYCSFSPGGFNPQASCGGSAQEVYLDYRHHLEWGKVFGKPVEFLIVKDLALTLGFDGNTKSDGNYNSKQRRWVWGPTVELAVPGYMNVGLYGLNESNQPCAAYIVYNPKYSGSPCSTRYYYKTHAGLMSSWAIPIATWPLSYEGYLNVIAAKGTSELGNGTKPEINWDSEIMLDVGSFMGAKNTLKLGFEYQYWRNKYGNDHTVPTSAGGPGMSAFAHTPEIRVEYHF